MSKHTPGPWTVDMRSDDCAYVDGPPRSYDECYFTNAADAYLIAAAPELLAVLKDCAADLAELAAVFASKGNTVFDELDHLRAADAAIAKAKGEVPARH